MTSLKRTVQSAFLDAGLTLEKDALQAFVSFIEDNNADQDLVYSLLDASAKGKQLLAFLVTWCLLNTTSSLFTLHQW